MRTVVSTFVVYMLGALSVFSAFAQEEASTPQVPGIEVGQFAAEVRSIYTAQQGLPSDDVLCVAVTPDAVYAGTTQGLARYKNGIWEAVPGIDASVPVMCRVSSGVIVVSGGSLHRVSAGEVTRLAALPSGLPADTLRAVAGGNPTWLATAQGLYMLKGNAFEAVENLRGADVRQVAVAGDGRVAVATQDGLFLRERDNSWTALYPHDDTRSWAPRDVRGVAFDSTGRLWFASTQGVGCYDAGWTLYEGRDGLPYNDFTSIAAGEAGVIWMATNMGAIRYDGNAWEYRQGLRWLPNDEVRAIAVTLEGHAWFATAGGIGLIERKPMTLREKAAFFTEEIDKYHRRTPYGYVLEVGLPEPGVKENVKKHDSDNDGLWTSMYGASACYAYSVTKDPAAKERATKAFEAVAFLSEVTQGGTHPAPPGFPARTILPTSGPDPNEGRLERDRETQQRDPRWKVIDPRWPVSEDGKWYWKCDTSSDELDGHYFFYALYYDLVAETEAEKARAREVVKRITDHLVEHDFELIDHDGKQTRWSRFSPKEMNADVRWRAERGLNSLSMLFYLKTAEYMTGDARYARAYRSLINDHGYLMNSLVPKVHTGPGTGNQSDDEMAFMAYYNLMKYEKDPDLLATYARSFSSYWRMESPELCPLFNYMYAASISNARSGRSAGRGAGRGRSSGLDQCLEEAADSLKRYPLDRVTWEMKNSHRIDILPLPFSTSRGRSGYRVNGKVLPIDERIVSRWNHNPWRLDYGGDGKRLDDGASFLLPYYMGLYHGFIIEE